MQTSSESLARKGDRCLSYNLTLRTMVFVHSPVVQGLPWTVYVIFMSWSSGTLRHVVMCVRLPSDRRTMLLPSSGCHFTRKMETAYTYETLVSFCIATQSTTTWIFIAVSTSNLACLLDSWRKGITELTGPPLNPVLSLFTPVYINEIELFSHLDFW